MQIREALTARELEVVRRVAHGDTNAEVGKALIIGTETVKQHIKNILGKLGAKNRAHAVAIVAIVAMNSPELLR